MRIDAKKHVLIVEDSPDLRLLVSRLLQREGYILSKAANGQEALDLLRSMTELPSMILLDIMMPVMDGFLFREAQEKDPRLAGIPVVVMTADSHPESKAERLRVKEIIRKPIDIDRLLEVTDRLCVGGALDAASQPAG